MFPQTYANTTYGSKGNGNMQLGIMYIHKCVHTYRKRDRFTFGDMSAHAYIHLYILYDTYDHIKLYIYVCA